MVKQITSLAILLLAGLLSSSLFADGDKVNLPGSNCVKWTPADPEPTLFYSAIYNPSSTTTLRLDCDVGHIDTQSAGAGTAI